jgi:hypothetical protein
MSDWLPHLVLVSGAIIFIVSMVYAVTSLRSLRIRRELGGLLERASAAAQLPQDEQEREFAEIKRKMQALSASSPKQASSGGPERRRTLL